MGRAGGRGQLPPHRHGNKGRKQGQPHPTSNKGKIGFGASQEARKQALSLEQGGLWLGLRLASVSKRRRAPYVCHVG